MSGFEWRNWSGSVVSRPASVHFPRSEADLRRVVAACDPGQTVRVAGAGHSFSPVAQSDDVLISLENYTGVTEVDEAAGRATVRAGTRLETLTAVLAEHGLMVENLGDVDQQTVAGALATGTHGTGIDFGVLATQVVGLRLLTADGDVLTLDPSDGDRFRAAQVSLGALGIVTEVTLDVRPQYRLREVEGPRDLDETLADVERLREAHRNFEFFWFPHTDVAVVKTLDETDDPVRSGLAFEEAVENAYWEAANRLGRAVPRLCGPLDRLTTNLMSETDRVGPAHRIYPTARTVRFNETEHSVPAEDGVAAFRDVREYVEREGRDVMFPVEFRYVAGDDIPLSPAYGRDSAFVAVHAYHRRPYRDFFEGVYDVFDRYDARPHWGKHHAKTAADLAPRYPGWDRFQAVRESLDPDGLFCNDHLGSVLGVDRAAGG
ncbi:MAG: D-arabinono-1,4-lactone oxidase [Haloarculaceae archaeon]